MESVSPSAAAFPRAEVRSLRALAIRWTLGLGALGAAFYLNYRTGTYIDRIGPGLLPARDFLFEHTPFLTFPNVHGWGFVGFLAVLTLGVALEGTLERAPFILWAYALIIAVRALFTVLTPLGLPPEAPTFENYSVRSAFQYFDFRHTLFFSGHTAFPFLGFLLSRRPWVRWACLGFSVLLATSVV